MSSLEVLVIDRTSFAHHNTPTGRVFLTYLKLKSRNQDEIAVRAAAHLRSTVGIRQRDPSKSSKKYLDGLHCS